MADRTAPTAPHLDDAEDDIYAMVPPAAGLFDPKREHDACGVGFIADLKKRASHRIVADALAILENLEHRGAVGADPLAGDGAGILIQIPDAFLREECKALKIDVAQARPLRRRPHLHAAGRASARPLRECLGPPHPAGGLGVPRLAQRASRQRVVVRDGQGRPSPCIASCSSAARSRSRTRRIRAQTLSHPQGRLERALRRLQGPRHRPLHRVAVIAHADLQGHVPVVPGQGLLQGPFRHSASPRRWRWCISASRPTPSRRGVSRIPIAWSPTTARSTRCAATSTGWRRGKHRFRRRCWGNDISKLWPISYEGQSDTACFDNALEFLTMGGYSLAHAAMMLIPEAWAGNPLMDSKRRAFYEYHACLMEPWDGPAAMAFSDGLPDWCDARSQRFASRALSRHQGRHRHHVVGVGRVAGR